MEELESQRKATELSALKAVRSIFEMSLTTKNPQLLAIATDLLKIIYQK